LSNCAGLAGEGTREVIEAVGDSNILHDVCLMKDVGTGGGDVDVNEIGRCSRRCCFIGHLRQEFADLSRGKLQAATFVEIGNLCLGNPWCNIGGYPRFTVVLRHNLNWLNPNRRQIAVRTYRIWGRGVGSYVNGSDVYSENIETMILLTISTFVLSRAVISMKTFLVSRVIFEWSPLMIGGREQTVLFES
jgi:hypothetical protein